MSLAVTRRASPATARGPRSCFCVVRPCQLRAVRSVRAADAEKNGAPTEAPKKSLFDEQEPIWVRRERERKLDEEAGKKDLPWAAYLLFSTFTAIAAVGSIFEFVDGNAFFGVVQPDSPAWAPLLLTFAVTGFPTAGYLFYKGVTGFNEAAERQDKIDGYLD